VLLVAAAAALPPADGTLRVFVVAALAFCLAGDVLLMLPADSTALFGAGRPPFWSTMCC
jgi:uncharacterized membrane protein YhhN